MVNDHEDVIDDHHLAAEELAELVKYFDDVGEAVKEPPVWVIEGLLPVGITFLAGPPKAMKSTVEMAMVCAVAGIETGVLPPDMRHVEEPDRVLGFCAEHSAGELRAIIEDGFDVSMPSNGTFYLAREPFQWRLDDPGAATRLMQWLDTFKPKLFFIDPLRDFHDFDEQDSGPMNRLLRPLQRWAKQNRSAFLVVHHTRKQDTRDADKTLTASDLRGSSALFGLADGVIVLTPRRSGEVHFDVVHKRGVAWERTVRLGVWGESATETLIPKAKEVFSAIEKHLAASSKNTSPTLESLAELTKASKSTVSEAVSQLQRIGALDKARLPTSTGAKLVESAAKKFAASK